MTSPRLLIPISLQFSVRYLLRTGLLAQIASVWEPVFLMAWKDEDLAKELAVFGEVHSLQRAEWGGLYERVRGIVDEHHRRRFASPSTLIRERRANLDRPWGVRARRWAQRLGRRLAVAWPGGLDFALRDEQRLFRAATNSSEVWRRLRALRADAVFSITPFLQDEEMSVRVCVEEGMPSCAAILSFDNLTTRSRIPIRFGRYLLWNRHNAAQLLRGYPETELSQVRIVGSPQFDFYWNEEYFLPESEWRKRMNLPLGRPVILFGGGHFTCAPHEPVFLRQLDAAIESGEIPGRPIILFRRHPVDPVDRWEPVLRETRHTMYDEPWSPGRQVLGHTNVRNDDIVKLASTLRHCAVHVNVASTLCVDGAILDRPLVGPAYDDSPGGKYHRSAYECYQQEHFLPILESGGLAVARSREQLLDAVCDALVDPGRLRPGRSRIVSEICTYADGRCTQRVADELASFSGESATNSQGRQAESVV